MEQLNYVLMLMLGLTAVGLILGQDSGEGVESIDSLTEESCSRKRSGCCSEFWMGDSPHMQKCMSIHNSKLPDENSEDLGKLVKFMSCFVECFYKRSKFIGKGDTLNMKMVKLEAEHLYADRPKEKEYYLETFEACVKKTQMEFNLLKNTPGSKVVLKNACRPYYMILQMCIMDYHHKHDCPYFRWEANIEKGRDTTKCKLAKAKCYEIDGLDVPESDYQ